MPERLTTDPAEVAQARTRRALETVERAQCLLDAAAEDLCSVQGMREGWELVCNLYERVKAGWRTLDGLRQSKGSALTLDPLIMASLKRGGGVPAVLRPYSEQLTCPGLYQPCAHPVRSRYDVAQDLAGAPARAWKLSTEPEPGDMLTREAEAFGGLEVQIARLAAELDGLCPLCAATAAFFVVDAPRPELEPGELPPTPTEAGGRSLRVTVAQLAGWLAVPLYQVREALGELRKRKATDAP